MQIMTIPAGKVVCLTEAGYTVLDFIVLQAYTNDPISIEVENKMRVLANLMIDRILEDKQKGKLKFKKK